jgi:hypothetical protein
VKFQELLFNAIQRSEIPLRFEPGAEEAVAQPIAEMLRAWVSAHTPPGSGSDFDAGWDALAAQLIAEIDGATPLPG